MPSARDLLPRFLAAQLSGDRREAVRLLVEEGLGAGLSPAVLQREVLQRAQYEIGRRWETNGIGVAEEHLATRIAEAALNHLYRHVPRAEPLGRTVLLACVEGELHEFGARIVANELEAGGFDVWYLGADVPARSLAGLVAMRRPDVVALSCTMPFTVGAIEKTLREVHQVAPGLPVAAGGQLVAVLGAMIEQLGAHAVVEEDGPVVEHFRGLARVPSRAPARPQAPVFP